MVSATPPGPVLRGVVVAASRPVICSPEQKMFPVAAPRPPASPRLFVHFVLGTVKARRGGEAARSVVRHSVTCPPGGRRRPPVNLAQRRAVHGGALFPRVRPTGQPSHRQVKNNRRSTTCRLRDDDLSSDIANDNVVHASPLNVFFSYFLGTRTEWIDGSK